ncbi:unnamed protein product [Polarella glacialis]|uniref:Uncharacterized protein n=1 Tax=Polarella glacialis TaxID=89957 RepID=A0A813ID91_POLGL|nr:unnamed protein product [Polarella glacialis]
MSEHLCSGCKGRKQLTTTTTTTTTTRTTTTTTTTTTHSTQPYAKANSPWLDPAAQRGRLIQVDGKKAVVAVVVGQRPPQLKNLCRSWSYTLPSTSAQIKTV